MLSHFWNALWNTGHKNTSETSRSVTMSLITFGGFFHLVSQTFQSVGQIRFTFIHVNLGNNILWSRRFFYLHAHLTHLIGSITLSHSHGSADGKTLAGKRAFSPLTLDPFDMKQLSKKSLNIIIIIIIIIIITLWLHSLILMNYADREL